MAASAPELDIVVWAMRPEDGQASSRRAQEVFDLCAGLDLHLALAQLPRSWFLPLAEPAEMLTCLRSVLMKPEHAAWMDKIWDRLVAASAS